MPSIPVRIVKPSPPGTEAYEAKRATVLQQLSDSIPENLWLSEDAVKNAGKDVTKVPSTCGLLTSRELEITETHDATSLAQAIATKTYSAVEVAIAFSKRAVIAHQLTCCLTEWFMDDAVARAKELDDYLLKTGVTVGPLHGVPVSIKVHAPMKGHYSSTGFINTIKKNDEDCQIVKILRDAGAVFYCKTNQPQAIMHLETTSFYGRTLNPYNSNLSAGGSSGGEAALIALRGSLLGLGTDIGGSIRGPAAFCGIYGFKPTTTYVPSYGYLESDIPCMLNIPGAAGPMAVSLRDMDLFMSVVIRSQPWLLDPNMIPIPWTGLNTPASPQPLKIGFMMTDGAIQPQPPVTRALNWARETLLAAGVKVVDFQPCKTAEAIANIRKIYWCNGIAGVKKCLQETGEPEHPLTEWICADAVPEGEHTIDTMYAHRCQRDAFWGEFAKYWSSQDADVIIVPAFVGPACEHDTAWDWNYTALWNYLDCPGAVFPTPIRTEGKEGTPDYNRTEPLSEECKRVRQLWEKGDFDGAPINLQIVARRYHDNQLFQALQAIKPILGLS